MSVNSIEVNADFEDLHTMNTWAKVFLFSFRHVPMFEDWNLDSRLLFCTQAKVFCFLRCSLYDSKYGSLRPQLQTQVCWPDQPINGGHVYMRFSPTGLSNLPASIMLSLNLISRVMKPLMVPLRWSLITSFIQSFTFFAAHPLAGNITLIRKFESGSWKTNMS